ncbi:MAG: hypothetical protein SOI44_02465 [Lactimicrobium sp.]|uniref:hypothetical protein n=1 Tax=Lactimicrobium sp. TaxID=2563780 RepID=UPI002F354A1D
MEKLSVLEERRRACLRTGEKDETALGKEYADYVRQQQKDAANRLDEIAMEQAYEQLLLLMEQENSRTSSVNGIRRSTSDSRRHASRLLGLKKQKEAMAAIDPDAFYVMYSRQVLQDIADERDGRLVKVPYLQRAMKQISDSLSAGIPVYLVGHLGSGKTQLALEASQDAMHRRTLYAELSKALSAWRREHPGASRNEELSWFGSVYPDLLKQVMETPCHPYFISGSHNLTAQDMFAEKTLKLAHAGSKESYGDQLNSLLQDFEQFLEANKERLDVMNPQQQMELMLAGWKTYSSMYINENSGFGTVVEKVEKEVLKALKEGKPIIIDEINTIAMPNLIALNDILQHHAGQSAYITGIGTVKIADGFCLIGTGNLSTGTVSYEGTNVLNPAFQSRFTTIAYNYVPQSTEGTLAQQKNPGENELFRLIIEHLCNDDGSLDLPDPSISVDALWRFAQLARTSQLIFEGRSSASENGDVPVLNEAVLSIRSIIHVLDTWNFGEEMDLSMALWYGFLSSVTNNDDRNLLLSLAVRYGFFSENEGWKVPARAKGEAGLTLEEIRVLPYSHEILSLEHLSRQDVVTLLFGKGPERKSLPDSLSSQIEIDKDVDMQAKDLMAQDSRIRDLEHGAAVLDSLDQGK